VFAIKNRELDAHLQKISSGGFTQPELDFGFAEA